MLHFFAYAEIIFAHILVFPACAIEVQHINENSPTIIILITLLLFRPNTLKVKCLRMTEKRHFSFLQKTWQNLYTVAELTLLMFELKPIL